MGEGGRRKGYLPGRTWPLVDGGERMGIRQLPRVPAAGRSREPVDNSSRLVQVREGS